MMNEFKYTPEDGLLNTVSFPTDPEDETAARQQPMTLFNQVKNYLNNDVKPAVEANSDAISTLQNPNIQFCDMRGVRYNG